MTSRNSKQMIASTTTNRATLRARKVGVALAIIMGTTAAFASDISIPPMPSTTPGTVVFGGQRNTGNQKAEVKITNITAGDVVINATAVGNNLSVTTNDKFNANSELQDNSGHQTAAVEITGPLTTFDKVTVNATAVGNNASYLGISGQALDATTARQSNQGSQTATFTWSLDPTKAIEVNATAVGNNMSIGRK